MRAIATVLLVACSQGTELEPPAVDTGVVGDTDQTLPIVKCGAPPYSVVHLQLVGEWDKRPPLAGARVSIDRCPELTVETDEKGLATIATTAGVPYDILAEHKDIRPLAIGQITAQLPVSLSWQEWALDPKLPYEESKPMIAVFFGADGVDPCRDGKGLRVAVAEHPEARTHYFRDGVDHDAPDPAAESRILIDGLAPDLLVRVVAEKEGCTTETQGDRALTGLNHTHRKFVSYAGVLIR